MYKQFLAILFEIIAIDFTEANKSATVVYEMEKDW
jgi:hypothetical protein